MKSSALTSKPILKLPSLAVSGIDCKINSREVGIDEIAVEGLSVALAREKDGSISLQKLVGTDNQTGGKPAPAQQEPAAAPAWTVQVKKFKFAGGAVSFDDLLPAQPAQFRIDPIDFTLSNISTVRRFKRRDRFWLPHKQRKHPGPEGSFRNRADGGKPER